MTAPLSPPILPELLIYRNPNWDIKDDINIFHVERAASEVDSGPTTRESSSTYVVFTQEHPVVSRRELWSYYGEFNVLLAISQC